MSKEYHTKALIIGAGPAGDTAAVYAARANLEPIVIQGLQPGGQLTITTDVENWPGEISILGPSLMEKMQTQAEHAGARMFFDIISSVDFSQRPFVCRSDNGDKFIAETVIIATGAQAKWLGLPSEAAYLGFGVSGCAVCDGAFFKGKNVVVVGGGNTAVEDALYLTNHAAKVTVVHRRDKFRAEKILQDRLFRHPKIDVMWDAAVDTIGGVEGPTRVTEVTISNLKTGNSSILACDGVFVAIGHAPATAPFVGHVDMDADGYIVTQPDSTVTSVPGVFAAGDVRDKVYRQAITAAGMGCMAALEAEKFVASQEDLRNVAHFDGPEHAMASAWD